MKERRGQRNLWSRDFSCITGATILSAIGGEAMSLPVSLLVFDETKSTLLAALLMVCGLLPDVLIPVLAAPFIDKGGKKRWIVGMDILLAAVYGAMGVWVSSHSFSYGLYLGFTLVVGTISVLYRLAYQAWYPNLILVGLEQKGYAVSSMIYPTVVIVMAPAAAFLYEKVSMGMIFGMVSVLALLSVGIESCIREGRKSREEEQKEAYSFGQYVSDIREGILYLKQEKGIRNIYTYMSITNGASEGVGILTQAYYQTQPWLTVTMLGCLKSAEMIGRAVGGLLQYKKEIPAEKRYLFTKCVYFFYDGMDALLLFMPYPLMVLNRFLCGGLGISSATVRETAVQSYLPEQIRARVNAFFDVAFAVSGTVCHMLAGILGQIMPFRAAAFLLGMLTFGSALFLIVRPGAVNRRVYEAKRKNTGQKTL